MAVGLPLVAGVLTALGLPIGSYIGSLTKAEIRHGAMNIRVFYHVLVAISVFLVLTEHAGIVWLPIAGALLIGGALAYVESQNGHRLSVWVMVLLGVMLASMLGRSLFPVVAAIVFMAGVAVGSLLHDRWRLIAQYAIMQLLSFLLAMFLF